MLEAVAKSPAMLVYLDNYINFAASSTAIRLRLERELRPRADRAARASAPRTPTASCRATRSPAAPQPDRLLPGGRRGHGARSHRLDLRPSTGFRGTAPRASATRASSSTATRRTTHSTEAKMLLGTAHAGGRHRRRATAQQALDLPRLAPGGRPLHRPQALPPAGRRLSRRSALVDSAAALFTAPVAGARPDPPGGPAHRAVERVPRHLGREGEAAVRDRRLGAARRRRRLSASPTCRSPTRTRSTPSTGSSRPAARRSSAGTRRTATPTSAAPGRAPTRASPSGGW